MFVIGMWTSMKENVLLRSKWRDKLKINSEWDNGDRMFCVNDWNFQRINKNTFSETLFFSFKNFDFMFLIT